MNYGENVFQLDEPDEWSCFIQSYTSGHKMLEIRAERPDEGDHRVIRFRKVAYHSGPMTWTGANFRMFEDDAMFEFLTQRQFPENWRHKDVALTYRLFQVVLEEGYDVIILANAGMSHDKSGNRAVDAPR